MRALVVAAIVALSSCKSTPADMAAFQAIKLSWAKVAPEYVECVKNHPHPDWVTPDQASQRLALVADLTELLNAKTKDPTK